MATQQPPARPWHRLASMAFRTIPAPTKQADPAPQPRPTFVRPALRPTSQPAPPPPQAPLAAAAPPVTAPMLLEPRSPPTAVAPVPGATIPRPRQAPLAAAAPPVTAPKPPVPRSPPTSVAPAPGAAPPQLPLTFVAPTPPSPATTTTSRSSSVLRPPIIRTPPSSSFPVTTPPKALPIPSVVPLPSSSSVKQSPIPKDSSQNPLAPKPVSPAPSQSPPPKMRSPSPPTLPPPHSPSHSEIKNPQQIQQKTVLVQETKEIPKTPSMISNTGEGLPKVYSNNPHDEKREAIKKAHSENKGENKGALLELAPSHFRKKYEFSNGVFRTWGEGEKPGSDSNSSNEQGKLKTKAKNDEAMAKKSPPMIAYVNSNVQGVNNSVLFNVSSTKRDPGVHLSLSRKLNGGRGFLVKEQKITDD